MGPMEAYRSSIQRRRRSVVCMLKPLLLGVGCVVPYRRWRDPRRVIVQEVPGMESATRHCFISTWHSDLHLPPVIAASNLNFLRSSMGGSVAELLACWTQAQ